MRAGLLSLLATTLIVATPLAAQNVNPVALAPGEVLAQSAGVGQVRSRPEVARFRLTITARADNAADARSACTAALRDLQTQLQSLGVPDAAITVLPPGTTQMGFVGNEAYFDNEAPNPGGAAALLAMTQQRKIATISAQIELTDMNRLTAVRQLLLDREDVTAQPPTLSLRDDTAVRRAAVAQAIAKAKEEADAYSAALGLRVSRVVRVFNPAATAEQPQMWSQVANLMNGGIGDEVVTEARVGMEVVLGLR